MLGAGCEKDNTGVHGGKGDTKKETKRESVKDLGVGKKFEEGGESEMQGDI